MATKHPAYEKFDLEIRGGQEMEGARKMARVTSHQDAARDLAETDKKLEKNTSIESGNKKEGKERMGAIFDPDKKITDKDWKNMRDNLRSTQSVYHNTFDYAQLAANMKITSPNRDFGYDYKFYYGEWRREADFELEECRKKNNYEALVELTKCIKILNPSEQLNLPDAEAKRELERLRTIMEVPGGVGCKPFSDMAVSMKILNMDPKVDQGTLQSIKREMEEYRKEAEVTNEWYHCISLVSNLKILNPSQGFSFSQTEQQGIEDCLEEYKRKAKKNSDNWKLFFSLAKSIKILAAEKVETTDKGLQITMPKK